MKSLKNKLWVGTIFLLITVMGLYLSSKSPITHNKIRVDITFTPTSTDYLVYAGGLAKNGYTYKLEYQDNLSATYKSVYLSKNTQEIDGLMIKKNNVIIDKVEIFDPKDVLIISFDNTQFESQWRPYGRGFVRTPPNIIKNNSILPNNYALNWKGDIYIVPALLVFYINLAIFLLPILFLYKKRDLFYPYIYQIKNYAQNNKDLIKYFCLSYAIIYINYAGVNWTNYIFADDIQRFPNGNQGFLQDSRYLSQLIYQIFTMNFAKQIHIATPYISFVSIAFLALTTTILAIYFNRKNIYISLAISSLLVIAPFYWELMLFRHDQLPMAFSLLIAIAITLFSYQLKHSFAFASQFFVLNILYFGYQPVILHYIMLSAFLCAYHLSLNEQTVRLTITKTIIAVSSLITSTLFYKIFSTIFLPILKSGYAIRTSGISKNLPPDFLSNRVDEITTILTKQWNETTFGYAILVLLILFIITLFYRFLSSKNSWLGNIFIIVSLLVMFISPFTVYLVNKLDIAMRFIFSINLFIALALIYIYNNSIISFLNKTAIVLSLVFVMICMTMTAFLGNVLQLQQEFDLQIRTVLQEDIFTYTKTKPIDTIYYQNKNHLVFIKQRANKELKYSMPYTLIKQSYNSFGLTNAFGYSSLGKDLSHVDLSNYEHKVVASRQYYDFFYYPELKIAVVTFKKDTNT